MGNQKTVATGRGRRKATARRSKNSATPAPESTRKSSIKFAVPVPETTHQIPRLVLNLKLQGTRENQPSSTVSQEEQHELCIVEPERATRGGRVIKRKVDDDNVVGSELDRLDLEVEFANTMENDGHYEGLQADIASSPLSIPITSKPSNRRGRPPKNTSNSLSAQDQASSSTICPSSPRPFNLAVDPTVYSILNLLQSQDTPPINLPTLTNTSGNEEAYSAQFLTHLYLLSYRSQQWHSCDLVADTWIRAFHQVNKNPNPECRIWRENRPLLKKAKEATKQGKKGVGFDNSAPEYRLGVFDPPLERTVMSFDLEILNELYQHTQRFCGARLLWADAMTLCGHEMEHVFERWCRLGRNIHPDLVFDIMCTGLRMVGKKLTLKIEECAERAWCKRYHEHEKHGIPCYREIAYKHKQRGRSVEGDDNVKMSRGDESLAKRVRFGGEDVDVDVDAEGESEEE